MIDNPFSIQRRPSKAYAVYVNPTDGSENKIIKVINDDKWLVAVKYIWDDDYSIKEMKAHYIKQYLYMIESTNEWTKRYASLST